MNSTRQYLFIGKRYFSSSSIVQSQDISIVYGAYGSPYTRKVEAAFRYKQIPFIKKDLMPGNLDGSWDTYGLSDVKPKVIPVIQFEDRSIKNDSTYVLQELDERHPDRNIIPSTPANRFLALLLEDMFDEWGTKIMFGVRWMDKIDQNWSGSWIGLDGMMGKGYPLKEVRKMGSKFGARQVDRMHLVGCKDRDTVYKSLNYFATALDNHLEKGSMFLLGKTPTVADFALYGQFSQLVVDRSPDSLLRDQFPNVWAWIRKCEDLSGLDEAHYEDEDGCLEFLRFAGSTYLPFLEANKQALDAGEENVTVTNILGLGVLHTQPVFKYQAKGYRILQEEYNKLTGNELKTVQEKLNQTNCIKFFS